MQALRKGVKDACTYRDIPQHTVQELGDLCNNLLSISDNITEKTLAYQRMERSTFLTLSGKYDYLLFNKIYVIHQFGSLSFAPILEAAYGSIATARAIIGFRKNITTR